jgi:OmcA/MtrC family decaheme c-type cytochrome
MKNLLLIFLFLSIGCTQTPLEKDKEKGVLANVLVPAANFFRTQTVTSDPDAAAAATNANAIATARSLPLLDLSTNTTYDPTTTNGQASIQALSLNGVVTNVDMSQGTPIVTFYIYTDTNRLKGFGWTTKSDAVYNGSTGLQTNTPTTYVTNLTILSNIQFTIAKFVAGTNGSPDKWVTMIKYSVPTPNGTNGSTTPVAEARVSGWATNNSPDNAGTLVDNGDGSYTYTFARDITKNSSNITSGYWNGAKTAILSTPGTALSTTPDFVTTSSGDLTYQPTFPHRLIVYIGTGTVRGTGTNNTNGTIQPSMSGGCSSKSSCSGSAIAAINFTTAKTVSYDFVPSTGQIKASQRDIVSTTTCNNCHKDANATTTSGITTRGLIFHGSGGRNDVKMCVTCHTDQAKAQSTTGANQSSSSYSFGSTGNGFLLDNESVVDFPIMVHKLHMSSYLTKSGAGYYPASSGYPFPTKAAAFITKADAKLCYNCHTTNKTANNEDNWKNKPSRMACGACHDGLDFTTGLLKSVNTSNNTTVPYAHGGGKQLDDSKCAGCHTVSNILTKHGL